MVKSLWPDEPLILVAAPDFRKPPLRRLTPTSASVPFGESSQATSGRCCGLALALAVRPVLRGRQPSGQAWCRACSGGRSFLVSFKRLPGENVILSLEALPLGSAHWCYMRCFWPRLWAQVSLRVSGLLSHFKRGFYSMTGNFSHRVISELAN